MQLDSQMHFLQPIICQSHERTFEGLTECDHIEKNAFVNQIVSGN